MQQWHFINDSDISFSSWPCFKGEWYWEDLGTPRPGTEGSRALWAQNPKRVRKEFERGALYSRLGGFPREDALSCPHEIFIITMLLQVGCYVLTAKPKAPYICQMLCSFWPFRSATCFIYIYIYNIIFCAYQAVLRVRLRARANIMGMTNTTAISSDRGLVPNAPISICCCS